MISPSRISGCGHHGGAHGDPRANNSQMKPFSILWCTHMWLIFCSLFADIEVETIVWLLFCCWNHLINCHCLCPLEVKSWQHSQQLYAGHKLQSEVLISFRSHLNIILSALICIRWRNFYFSLISFLLLFYVCNAQVKNNCLQQVKMFLYKYISRPCWILTYNLLINGYLPFSAGIMKKHTYFYIFLTPKVGQW